jgi:hypothetical protein
VPDWAKPVLVDSGAVVLVTADDAGADVVVVKLRDVPVVTAGDPGPRILHWWQPTETSYSLNHAPGLWWAGMRTARASELFGHWPALRSGSVVLVMAYSWPDTPGLRGALEKAARHERREVRAAALHALARFYAPWAVEAALPYGHDADPKIRSAARASLHALVAAPDCDSHDYAGWWRELDAEQRQGLFEVQWAEALDKGRVTCRCKEDR